MNVVGQGAPQTASGSGQHEDRDTGEVRDSTSAPSESRGERVPVARREGAETVPAERPSQRGTHTGAFCHAAH